MGPKLGEQPRKTEKCAYTKYRKHTSKRSIPLASILRNRAYLWARTPLKSGDFGHMSLTYSETRYPFELKLRQRMRLGRLHVLTKFHDRTDDFWLEVSVMRKSSKSVPKIVILKSSASSKLKKRRRCMHYASLESSWSIDSGYVFFCAFWSYSWPGAALKDRECTIPYCTEFRTVRVRAFYQYVYVYA